LRDPIRSSLVDSAGNPLGGQGIAVAKPPIPGNGEYEVVDTTEPALLDAAYALQQSWDFFFAAFDRRGLKGLAPSTSSLGNDGILFLDPSKSDFNADFDQQAGTIAIHSGGSDWRAMMTLESVGHEWSHGVFTNDVGTITEIVGEMAGLNEA